jgi:glycosyltransferase involved in cell wall biosynthesis
MIDPFDDLGTAKRPFRVVAVIPVHERLELLPLTISRLLKKNGLDRVICVGDGLKEKAICMEAGAMWVPHQNKPLGAKWNAGFKAARELKPDAILFVGSSDWVCDHWITIMQPYLNQHHIIGVPGCHFIDFQKEIRAVNWAGYTGPRKDETIGIGRMISAKLLDKIGWMPFDDTKDNSMDRCMKDKCSAVGEKEYFVRDENLKAASISTNRWKNKHVFEMHWNNLMPSEKVEYTSLLSDFPEIIDLHEKLK